MQGQVTVPLAQDHSQEATAFAMGQHPRLGNSSVVMLLDEQLVYSILQVTLPSLLHSHMCCRLATQLADIAHRLNPFLPSPPPPPRCASLPLPPSPFSSLLILLDLYPLCSTAQRMAIPCGSSGDSPHSRLELPPLCRCMSARTDGWTGARTRTHARAHAHART